MTEKMEKLLNQIGINEDYMDYFKYCYVEQILIDKTTNRFHFIIHLNNLLPINVYDDLLTCLKEAFHREITITLNYDGNDYSLASDYLNRIMMEYATTAVRYNVPVVVIIMNNGVLGMVRQWQTLFYDKHYSNSVLQRKTDFAAFARSFGADGEAVTTPEELDEALAKAFKTEGPYIIDCKIDKDEFVLPMLPPGGSMDDIITKLEVEL